MDYDWKYFVEDLSKTVKEQGAAADREVWREVSRPLPEGTIKALRDSLAWGFRGYREAVGERREVLAHLLAVHTELCRAMPWDSLLKRRHNALVYRYAVETVAGNRAIAKKLNISKDTMYADLEGVMRDMLVLCVGLPYLMQGKRPEIKEAVKLTIKQYLFWDKSGQMEQCLCLFPVHIRGDVRVAAETTRRYMLRFNEAMTVYTDFCEQHDPFCINGRRLEVLKQNINGNNRVAQEVAKKYTCSPETVYSDMKENQERLCCLLSVFLQCEKTERSVIQKSKTNK